MTNENKPVTTSDLVADLFTVRTDKAKLEKREKELMSQLVPQVDPTFNDLSDRKEKTELVYGCFRLVRSPGSQSRVDPQMLLDHGIGPDVIAACTKRSSYNTYRVVPVTE